MDNFIVLLFSAVNSVNFKLDYNSELRPETSELTAWRLHPSDLGFRAKNLDLCEIYVNY